MVVCLGTQNVDAKYGNYVSCDFQQKDIFHFPLFAFSNAHARLLSSGHSLFQMHSNNKLRTSFLRSPIYAIRSVVYYCAHISFNLNDYSSELFRASNVL